MTSQEKLEIEIEVLKTKLAWREMMIEILSSKARECLASTSADYQSNVDSLIKHVLASSSSVKAGK